ncbi:unnamed protein product [Danaus chrysippus]|uniref:(African queen) hypothetical protein n=1 Tax=Danaus chrysippus TaxID=151541 RepID=A0A8J2QZP8_9NEOP|nr:unnamed protein product [Danaus chrysippus]
MKFPVGINKNTYITYKSKENLEKDRKIKSEVFDWDSRHPKSLAEMCVEKLSLNWMGEPKLEDLVAKDREHFLQILDTDIPLQILVDNIQSDIFWKKCYVSKWSDIPIEINDKSWITIFMERYYADFLEQLNPRQYDPEKVRNLVKLCGPFIHTLSIRSLVPSDLDDQRNISPEMAGLISGQRQDMSKINSKTIETMPRGPVGIEYISQVLNHTSCGLRILDLRLNNKLGSEGIAQLAVAIARGCNLISLNISGCGIKPHALLKPPAGVWSAINADNPPTCGDLLARAIGLVKTPLRSLDISINNIGTPSDNALSNAICLSYLVDINLKRSGMGSMAMAIAESAAAAQRLRREAEKGIRFRRSAGRLVQARRVVKGMNIDADPLLLAQQLSARPSIVSVASEEGVFNIQTQPLSTDFSFVPSQKSPRRSSRESSITGLSTSRRSSHHTIFEPAQVMQNTFKT